MPAQTKQRAFRKKAAQNPAKKASAKKATTKKTSAKKASAKKVGAARQGTTKKVSAGKKKALRRGPDTEVTREVLEFIGALDDYKKEKNRPFPTWSEVLEVVRRLGYRKP